MNEYPNSSQKYYEAVSSIICDIKQNCPKQAIHNAKKQIYLTNDTDKINEHEEAIIASEQLTTEGNGWFESSLITLDNAESVTTEHIPSDMAETTHRFRSISTEIGEKSKILHVANKFK